MEKDWVRLRTYSDAIRAEMAKQQLEENSIAAVLLNKQDSSFKFGRIDLFVRQADAEMAKQLIGTHQDGGSDEG